MFEVVWFVFTCTEHGKVFTGVNFLNPCIFIFYFILFSSIKKNFLFSSTRMPPSFCHKEGGPVISSLALNYYHLAPLVVPVQSTFDFVYSPVCPFIFLTYGIQARARRNLPCWHFGPFKNKFPKKINGKEGFRSPVTRSNSVRSTIELPPRCTHYMMCVLDLICILIPKKIL